MTQVSPSIDVQKLVPQLKPQPSVYKLVDLPEPSSTNFRSVYVTNVRSPGSLQMQLIGKETTQVLECLHEDMTGFYKTEEGKKHTTKEVYPGQVRGLLGH